MKAIKRIGFVLVSLLVASFILAPLAVRANTNADSPSYDVNSKHQVYKCQAYTRNTVQDDGKLTDNEPQQSITTVKKDPEGFVVKSGDAFKSDLKLDNGLMGPDSNMGNNKRTILMMRNEVPGAVYFMIYTFKNEADPKERTNPANSPIDNLTVLGQCQRKQ